MKLIVRADDFGYTEGYNAGTIKAIEEGIVTSADLMLDTPGAVDAMERIKKYPWISIGWHAHFWGRPVLPPEEVPSMVDETGKFKFRKQQSLKATCVFEEVLKECHAQMERCIQILGKVPDTAGIQRSGTAFEEARRQICEEYGIAYNFMDKPDAKGVIAEARECYQHLHIYMPNQPASVYQTCYEDSYEVRMTYDPVQYYLKDEGDILKREIALTAWHPGYLDDYILQESRLREARIMDIAALCDNRLKEWIIDHHIELINHRDALYGTHEYQNHLRSINSPLYIGGSKE